MIDSNSIQNFLKTGVLAIVIIVGAIIAATRYKQGGIRQAAEILGVTVLACLLVAVATHTDEVGSWIWSLVSGKK